MATLTLTTAEAQLVRILLRRESQQAIRRIRTLTLMLALAQDRRDMAVALLDNLHLQNPE